MSSQNVENTELFVHETTYAFPASLWKSSSTILLAEAEKMGRAAASNFCRWIGTSSVVTDFVGEEIYITVITQGDCNYLPLSQGSAPNFDLASRELKTSASLNKNLSSPDPETHIFVDGRMLMRRNQPAGIATITTRGDDYFKVELMNGETLLYKTLDSIPFC